MVATGFALLTPVLQFLLCHAPFHLLLAAGGWLKVIVGGRVAAGLGAGLKLAVNPFGLATSEPLYRYSVHTVLTALYQLAPQPMT